MKEYTQEFKNYATKYPVTMTENYKNGRTDTSVFVSMQDAKNYITRRKTQTKRTTFTIKDTWTDKIILEV